MVGLWIDASSALKLVARFSGETEGAQALCTRAYVGLVKTRVRLLVHEERRAENVELPSFFWEAEGLEGLAQNWLTGDFAAWIDGKGEYRAFGVTFDLDGVLGMLPFEERALTARRLSVAGNPAWMPAQNALQLAQERLGMRPARAGEAVIGQARLGFVTARAVLAQRFDRQHAAKPLLAIREWDIPSSFWQEFTLEGQSLQDWELGVFKGWEQGPDASCAMTLTGVHFLATSLQALLPPAEPVPSAENGLIEASAKIRAGGRLPQPWWDDMWCAVSGLIFHGFLVPAKQAQIEEAMLTWAAMKGHEISETAIKPKARKLFEAYQDEGTNFLAG